MIHVEQSSGVGIHGIYTVFDDGKPVGKISRFGTRYTWRIQSIHYGEVLASGGQSIAGAKQLAITLEYPSAEEIYQRVCERIEGGRRAVMERHYHADLMRLTRALLAGSNSAQAELAALVAKIDAIAEDRADTRQRWRETGGDFGPHKHEDSRLDFYPEPPKENST